MKTLKHLFYGKANKLFFVGTCLVLVSLGLVALRMAWDIQTLADQTLPQVGKVLAPGS